MYKSYIYYVHMKTVTFTSTINPTILKWATEFAEKTDKTRRDILEEALLEYKKTRSRELLKKSFLEVAKSHEDVEMAEWGMDDYAQII